MRNIQVFIITSFQTDANHGYVSASLAVVRMFVIRRRWFSRASPVLRSSVSGMSVGRGEHLTLTAHQHREPDVLAARVVDITSLSSTVRGLTLQLLQPDNNITFQPGQCELTLDLFGWSASVIY